MREKSKDETLQEKKSLSFYETTPQETFKKLFSKGRDF